MIIKQQQSERHKPNIIRHPILFSPRRDETYLNLLRAPHRRALPWLRAVAGTTYTRGALHDISAHQSVAAELIESTSLHRNSGGGKRTDGDLARISHHQAPVLRGQITQRGGVKLGDNSEPSIRLFGPVTVRAAGEMAGILAWFWNERFWLPHNVTWADLKNTDEATFPQAEDLYLACPLAFCIFMIRLVFERWVWEREMERERERKREHMMRWSRWLWCAGGSVLVEWCSTRRCPVFVSLVPKQWASYLVRPQITTVDRPSFFSAGLQQNALSASDASVSVQPSYQTCPTDRPSSQVKPGVGGSAQHRAGDRLLFTNPAFLFSNSNAPLVIGCTSLLLLYGHQCKVWHRSTMVTAMLVLHMWVRSLFRESFSPLNPSLMFSTGPRIYS